MKTTDGYLAAGTAHDAAFERLHAPSTQHDASDDEPTCDWCGLVTFHGDFCDRCLVTNANDCGDWDNESIAAFHRINNTPTTC